MDKPLHKAIGENIFRRRQRLGYAQREFAAMVPCGLHQLINFEHGRGTMSMKLLCELADMFKIPCSALVREAEHFLQNGGWPVDTPLVVLPKPEKQTWITGIMVHRISDTSPVPELDKELV